MKRNILIVWLLAALLTAMLAGCAEKPSSHKPATGGGTDPQTSAAQQDNNEDPAPRPTEDEVKTSIDWTSVYAPILDETCEVLYNGYNSDMEYDYPSSGIMEMAMYLDRDELLKTVGYTLRDLNGDGIPELLIGTVPGSSGSAAEEKNTFFSGYTWKDGEAVRFLDGWARNCWQWLGDGRFFNMGSGGAAYSAFGTFHINADGTELVCEDFYFTDVKGDDVSNVVYCHNTTGVWDAAEAEELTLDPDAFWALSETLAAPYADMELTPFADYAYTGYVAQAIGCKVRADYQEDVEYKYSTIDDASSYLPSVDSEYAVRVLFQTKEDVKDFKLLAMAFKDVDENGRAIFDATELFSIPTLRAGIPLSVPMSFPGDIPSSGFSYTDADGSTKTFTISISGRDGSLVTSPLD